MTTNYLVFKGLFDIWKSRNYDLYFYFQEIFSKAIEAATERTLKEGIQLKEGETSKYKALFTPVGFSIENISLITALLKPDYLQMAFTETSRNFHRNNIHLVEENIRHVCPAIKLSEVRITSDDQKYTEQKILQWVDEMSIGYGLSYNQMAIDLTGGTKPMSIGANNAALSFEDIDAFYLRSDYDEDTAEPIPGTETLIPLKKEKSQVDKDLVFVIMPFDEKYNEVYRWIEKTVIDLNLKCLRVDKEIFIGGIMDKVRENILKAGIILADLTGKNLNVYYELGLSHAYAKKVIMLTQNVDDVPFDLKHFRMVVYKADNKAVFIEQLSTTLLKIMDK